MYKNLAYPNILYFFPLKIPYVSLFILDPCHIFDPCFIRYKHRSFSSNVDVRHLGYFVGRLKVNSKER